MSAQGGSRRAAQASVSGRATAQRVGAFVAGVARDGLRQTLAAYDLARFIGQDIETILAAAVDILAPAGAQLEEAAARAAATTTLRELFEERGAFETGLDSLERLTADDARSVTSSLVSNYIFERLLQVLARSLETHPAAEVIRLEEEVQAFIRNTVDLDLSREDVLSIDWNGEQGRHFIDRIFADGYALIEAL